MRQVSWTSAVLVPLAATPLAVVLLWLVRVPLAPLSLMLIAGVAAALLATRQAMSAADHARAIEELSQAVEAGKPEAAAPLPHELATLRDAVAQRLAQVEQERDTALREASEARAQRLPLEVQLRQLQGALEHLQAAVLVSDALDEVVLASRGAAELLGRSSAELRRCRLAAIPGGAALAERMRSVRQGGEADLEDPGTRLPVGPQAQPCTVRVGSIKGAAGEGRLAVVAQIEPETALTAARRQDADLVACMSHELRTPLSSIRAYLEMLMDGEAEDELSRSQFYAIMEGETNRLMRLIDNVLGLNRVEAGLGVLQKQVIDLAELVSETFELIQPQGRAHRLTMRLEPLAPVRVLADRDLLVQVLTNLLGNAIKYTPAGGTVTVTLEEDAARREAVVTVRDTGVGIPAKDLPHVFERFYRVGDHRRLASGTGLGLALVRQVIESLHAGRIEVRSEVDRGSAFTFALPIAEEG